MFAHRQSDAGLLLVAGKWQVGIENILCPVNVAGRMRAANVNHHFRVGKACHGAISASGQFFGQEQSATVAGEDRNARRFAAITCRANRRQLRQPRAVFVLEHDARGRVFENTHDDRGGHLHPRCHRVVLQDPGHVLAKRFMDHVKVSDDLIIRAHGGRWRDHHAGCAHGHHVFG